jgi:hypothetical protein
LAQIWRKSGKKWGIQRNPDLYSTGAEAALKGMAIMVGDSLTGAKTEQLSTPYQGAYNFTKNGPDLLMLTF